MVHSKTVEPFGEHPSSGYQEIEQFQEGNRCFSSSFSRSRVPVRLPNCSWLHWKSSMTNLGIVTSRSLEWFGHHRPWPPSHPSAILQIVKMQSLIRQTWTKYWKDLPLPTPYDQPAFCNTIKLSQQYPSHNKSPTTNTYI